MRIKIGGRDPRFKHIGGRDMNGIDRMFQLFVSLQILFGSRRGFSVLLPLLILGAIVAGGWFAFNAWSSPQRQLERAHADWDSGVSTRQISAIVKYKELLQKDNPLEPGMRWLQNDRDTLYRRIVEHQVLYEKDDRGAREWIIYAWDEGIRDLRFADGEVNDFWKTATDSLRGERTRQRESSSPPDLIDDPRLNGIPSPVGS
ncbi:hypothetical protein [Mariniblastus fucicola]|uniref:Uncharacterized protein n=1 Tax=Mariniblastus fucicola TaxID=980251 RepID=A0A5B9P334_9BACT|nr:hypothetical protein [Mariniblastus fucicola]QEG20788.1 hypothetical protein MFFC18_06390 [Mariniblastus fucicola]